MKILAEFKTENQKINIPIYYEEFSIEDLKKQLKELEISLREHIIKWRKQKILWELEE